MEHDTLTQTVGAMYENGRIGIFELTFKIPRYMDNVIPIYGINKETGDRYVVSFGQVKEV